ncbi:MAG: glycosyltransferase [Candidatus Binatia bacterium]
MNVLFVCTRLPVPPWRGDQVRAFHHLRVLAPRHRITVMALVPRSPAAAVRAEVERLGVRLVVLPLGVAGAGLGLARALVDPRPLQVLLYVRRRVRARLAALMAHGGFDVVHAQLVRTADYLPGPEGPPVVVDLIDALSENLARRARLERGLLGPVVAWEARRLGRFERELATRVAACLVVSEAERAAIGVPTVRVVPNGVDVEGLPYVDEGREPGRILFAGNLGYFPNVDAACWLAHEVFPRIRAAVPTAELRLVGARPARAVRALAGAAGVTVVGAVPAMAPELWRAAVALAPMRAGSGVQNKVLEAMAAGLPVVTTPGPAGAIGARPGEHLSVAADAAGLAAATVAVLCDPARGRGMARAARRLVEREWRWESSARGVEVAWEAARGG